MPLTRRQIYRRRRILVFGGLGVLLAGVGYLPLTLLAPVGDIEPVVAVSDISSAEAAVLTPPEYGASGIEALGGDGVLARSGSTEALPIASITKIITALVVLEAYPLAADEAGPTVTMTDDDVALYRQYDALGASVAPVQAGVSYTERELLEVMLIDSAGNYAVTLANWAFGSPDAWLSAARAWLDTHQLSGVTVIEPTGRDPGNRATVEELLQIGELALADPVLAEIVATPSITIHDIGELENGNKLLGQLGIDGIKTGTLNAYGANLLFSADLVFGEETVTLVGVVLGADTHERLRTDVLALLAQVQAGYREVPLIAAGDVVASYTTPWDTTASGLAGTDATVLVWGDTAVEVKAEIDATKLAEAGRAVGELVFTAGNRTVTVPVVLSDAIEDPGPWWRLGHPGIIFGITQERSS